MALFMDYHEDLKLPAEAHTTVEHELPAPEAEAWSAYRGVSGPGG